MANQVKKWYEQSGAEGDVVISTRVRLARNLSEAPFPARMSAAARKETAKRIRDVFPDDTFNYLEMENMLPRDAMSMAERHLISPEFSRREEGSAVLISSDENTSIMVNEEDHLRIQIMCPGLDLDGAFSAANRLDNELDRRLGFAFDDRLGYLTQCPTNLGTGMRASIMMHLPALQECGTIQQLANTVSKLGLTVRGIYGEGSKPEGAMYQLSNQITLGISEQAAIDNLKGIAVQVIREERNGRTAMINQNPRLEDHIWRALGLLASARILSHDEFMALCSRVRLGVSLGCIEHLSYDVLNKLVNDVQPATIMAVAGKDLEPVERDTLRAEIVRRQLTLN